DAVCNGDARLTSSIFILFFQAEDGIRARNVTGVQTCALPICLDPLGGDPVFDQVGVHGVRLVAGNRTVVTGDDDPVDASLLVQAHGQVQAAGQKGGGAVLPPCGAEDGGDGAMGCVLPVVAAAQARQPCPEQ